MSDNPSIDRLYAILAEARQLAASENVMMRVAGERIAVIAADVLTEADLSLANPIALLPEMVRVVPNS
jgi:hypothetical protein